MKQLEVDLDQLKLTIKQLKDLRRFMDESFTQDKTEKEEFKSKLVKQSFELTIAYLVHTQSMIKKFQEEKNK
jgi:hypothetical protein